MWLRLRESCAGSKAHLQNQPIDSTQASLYSSPTIAYISPRIYLTPPHPKNSLTFLIKRKHSDIAYTLLKLLINM